MRGLLVVLVVAAVSAPALAQGQRLPRMSTSEQAYIELNRSLEAQEQQRRQVQQNQFDTNQLRNDLSRQQVFPPMTGTGVSRICPPGSIGC